MFIINLYDYNAINVEFEALFSIWSTGAEHPRDMHTRGTVCSGEDPEPPQDRPRVDYCIVGCWRDSAAERDVATAGDLGIQDSSPCS